MNTHPVLIAGQWRQSKHSKTFQATNPNNRQAIDEAYPVSDWSDCEQALAAAQQAFLEMRNKSGAEIGTFLDRFAQLIETRADELVELAHQESGLPKSPRLADGELPRTTNQLRQAATAARAGDWKRATIDTANNIRSCLEAIGPVLVLGPNNFPFAFNSVAGGDFVAAIAAGNPVIGKANSSHPGTTRIFAEQALVAAQETGMPDGLVQLLYRVDHADGERLVSDKRIAAIGFTGSRHAGLKLKAAADQAGKPIYLELSSINPVVMLPAAVEQQTSELADQFVGSCLMGAGQFCTNPGLVLLVESAATEKLIKLVAEKFDAAVPGTLLSPGVEKALQQAIATLEKAGAQRVTSKRDADAARACCANTLLRVSADKFIADAEAFQTEAFGNSSLVVTAKNIQQLVSVIRALEGNLTGCIYSASQGDDDQDYQQIAPELTLRVGRILNDKMPTGVAVSPAMNHGGPFPATGHPVFTAVGIPASICRFSKLQCYDNVREQRLPVILRNQNLLKAWRSIDGQWTRDDIAGS
jgi:NADP-dependent aldehyde dehydrogenase